MWASATCAADACLEGLEPACVNACPENAIQIEIVNKITWREDYAAAESPGMPPAGNTVSTTRITLPENTASWLERVDNGHIGLEHAHPSLVVMTTTMQATFGALVALVLMAVRWTRCTSRLWCC